MEYIIYLHPKPGTLAYEQLMNFWSLKIDKNMAFNYPFHVTITGFFKDDKHLKVLYEQIQRSVKINNMSMHHENNFHCINIESDDLHTLIDSIRGFAPVKNPNGLHMTLIHNTNGNALVEKKLIEKHIDIDLWDRHDWMLKIWRRKNKQWEIVII